VDRIAPVALHLAFAVDRLADDIEEAAEGRFADRDGDRSARCDRFHPPAKAVGGRHRDGPDPVVPQVLLNLGDHIGAVLALHDERVVDLGQVALFELDVQDRADDLHDPAGVLAFLLPRGSAHR
jgi:hypothetical protein